MEKTIFLFLVLVSVISGGLAAFHFRHSGDGGSIIIPDFPQPLLARSYVPPSEVPSSRITVPVTLLMSDLESLANRNLIRQYDGSAEFRDRTVNGRLSYTVRRAGDAGVTERNGRIRISLPVDFHVRFTGNARMAVARVPFSVQTEGALNIIITIRPSIRSDWNIKTEAEVDFAWIRPPYLNVAGLRISLRSETDKFLRNAIRSNLHKIDEIINKEIRLKDIMQRQWDNLAAPVKTADAVFFHFYPRSIAASPLSITPSEVTLRTSVETGISLSIGLGDVVQASEKDRKELPPLEQYIPGDDLISLNVRTLLNYNSLEQEAMSALSGQSLNLGIASVTVSSLRFMGSGEKLVMAFEISAGAESSSGTIYALGRPHFDEDTRILSIKNFDLDGETRDGLMRTAAWLLRPALVRFLSGRLEWELGSKIDNLADEARDIIASLDLSDEIELRGTLESEKFDGLRVTDRGIEIGLSLEGSAALRYIPAY